MNKREEQKEQRKKEIIMTSLDLFVKKGYGATTIADIAKAAGMSNGLMFHYFKSKEELYLELIKIGLTGTEMSMSIDASDPLEFFKKSAYFIFEAIKKHEFTAKMFVLMGDASSSEDIPQSAKELVNKVNNIYGSIDIIKKGQEMGEIREGDPLALSNAFWSSIQGIAESVAIYKDIPCPDVEWIIDIIRKH